MWPVMDETTRHALRTATRRLARAEEGLAAAREGLRAAIVEAFRNGARPSEILTEVPWQRDYIRKIAKEAGIPPLKEPTVVSKRQAEAGE